MKKSQTWQLVWQHWLNFSAFTLAGVAFEGARFGCVPPATVAEEATKWRKADASRQQNQAGAQA
ncbi:hypothetical protein [Pantoea sp.]|uniref:hypothetical protein n=1 Tax=Pantoea sp. TaxID=69393 RepID=UPI0028B01C92|nr:hypothetical protein [Pantoea sp.]